MYPYCPPEEAARHAQVRLLGQSQVLSSVRHFSFYSLPTLQNLRSSTKMMNPSLSSSVFIQQAQGAALGFAWFLGGVTELLLHP